MDAQLRNGDTEIAHGNADGSLVELVELLAKRSKYKTEILEVVEMYHSVDKWYA